MQYSYVEMYFTRAKKETKKCKNFRFSIRFWMVEITRQDILYSFLYLRMRRLFLKRIKPSRIYTRLVLYIMKYFIGVVAAF